jgi:hypothetical protein
LCFTAVSMSHCHSFGVLRWFTRPMILSTCLRGMMKNSSFSCFRVFFVSYCPLFWGSVEIYKKYDSLYILERNDKKKLIFFVFMAVFVNYCPLFWVPGWFTRPMTLSIFLNSMTKNSSFLRLWPF